MDDTHIGARIAAERKLRGLSQQQLADRAYVSKSLITKIEQGRRPASPAVITALASALHVDRTALTGQPYRTGQRRDDAVHDLLPPLRRELLAYRAPPPDRPRPSRHQLASDVNELSRLAQRVDVSCLGNRLPGVLADLRLAAHTSAGAEREQVMSLWAQACQAARQLTYTLGYGDLAAVVADRLHWAAVRSGDPLAVGVADAERAHDLIGVGEWDAAHRLLAARLGELDDQHVPPGPAGPATLSVRGYLHLRSALARAGAGDAAGTWDHVREAEALARRVGGDRNDYRLAFGPTNVAIWGVSLAVEMMDGATAVSRAARVRLTAGLPVERAGHHHIDLARAQLLHGDRSAALEALLTARRICPQQTRFHPMARETVYDLANTERRRSDSLRGLATWMGLED